MARSFVEPYNDQITRSDGVHRQIAAYPTAYLAKGGISAAKLNNIYDPVENPSGVGYRVSCAFPDDMAIDISPTTEDAINFCDTASKQEITGYDYNVTGNPDRDRNVDAWSASNALRLLGLKKLMDWTIVDIFGDEENSRNVTPTGDVAPGMHYRAFDVVTDDYRDSIANNQNAQSELALLGQGKISTGIVRL
jgi:hypothetical protein